MFENQAFKAVTLYLKEKRIFLMFQRRILNYIILYAKLCFLHSFEIRAV